MFTTGRAKWYDGGTECNLCPKEAMWGGLCVDCRTLPHPRPESKAWNDAIKAAAKWLEEWGKCTCEAPKDVHSVECVVTTNRATANAMKESLRKTQEVGAIGC